MPLSPSDWHRRFQQQAGWTTQLRGYLYPLARVARAQKILEVGCGTGAILADLRNHTSGSIHGLDIDTRFLALARQQARGAHFVLADAHGTPYVNGAFDVALCHFFLLWVEHPDAVVREMARVTRQGGAVLALAEPDYGGRVDFPPELKQIGDWQEQALRRQGAEPLMGRQLATLFRRAGLEEVETGVLGGQWRGPISAAERNLEWDVLKDDLRDIVSDEVLETLYQVDEAASARGERILYVPTFYALGRVPESYGSS